MRALAPLFVFLFTPEAHCLLQTWSRNRGNNNVISGERRGGKGGEKNEEIEKTKATKTEKNNGKRTKKKSRTVTDAAIIRPLPVFARVWPVACGPDQAGRLASGPATDRGERVGHPSSSAFFLALAPRSFLLFSLQIAPFGVLPLKAYRLLGGSSLRETMSETKGS